MQSLYKVVSAKFSLTGQHGPQSTTTVQSSVLINISYVTGKMDSR